MRWVAAVVLCLVAAMPAAGAAEAKPKTKTKAKAKVTCRWTKATKKSKRRRVCVKVKVKAKSKAPVSAKVPTAVAPVVPTAAPVAEAPPAAAPSPAVVADAATPTPPTAPTPVIARLQVTSKEFLLRLSRPSIVAGPATIQLLNAGEDPHDLRLRPADGGTDLLTVPETLPGEVVDRDLSLAAGRYTLYCSLPGHEDLGMRATLTVS